MTRAVLATALLCACAAVPTHAPSWRVEHVDGPVRAYCTTEPGPCHDDCGDDPECACTCWVDGLADHRTRTVVLSTSPQADSWVVGEHELCHARGGSEDDCR